MYIFFTLSPVPLFKSVECTSPVKPVLFVPLERQQPFTIRFLAKTCVSVNDENNKKFVKNEMKKKYCSLNLPCLKFKQNSYMVAS